MTAQSLSPPSEPHSDNQSLGATFRELEVSRRQAVATLFKSIVVLAICVSIGTTPLPYVFEFTSTGSGSGEITAFLGRPMSEVGDIASVFLIGWPLVWIVAGFWWFRSRGLNARSRYLQTFKTRALNAMCRRHFPTLRYEPGKGMDWRIFDSCNLFAHGYSDYYSEDRFSGRWGSTDVAFAEAVARRRYRKLTLKGFETVTETYFQGLIFIADFHKHFNGTTRLIPKGEDIPDARSEQPAELENPFFESFFETSTTDQVEVRYLLSTSMLERFISLHDHFPKLRARFHNESLLLLLPSRLDRFEPSLFRHAANRVQFDQFVEDLDNCLNVVDELNLNLRIWSKV